MCNSDRLVSVPYWGSLYFNKTKVIMMLSMVDQRFRPLLGFFIFQSTMRDLIEILKAFPSPIGVLYISIEKEYSSYEDLFEFPSPIGVLYISMLVEMV